MLAVSAAARAALATNVCTYVASIYVSALKAPKSSKTSAVCSIVVAAPTGTSAGDATLRRDDDLAARQRLLRHDAVISCFLVYAERWREEGGGGGGGHTMHFGTTNHLSVLHSSSSSGGRRPEGNMLWTKLTSPHPTLLLTSYHSISLLASLFALRGETKLCLV